MNAQNELNAAGTNTLLGGLGAGVGLGYGIYKSDENAKEDKSEIGGALEALKKMPVEAWRYKEGEGDGKEHIGPYAQDFKKATGLGDGKTISVIDALGVTMKAIQELSEEIDRMSAPKTAARPKAKSIFKRAA